MIVFDEETDELLRRDLTSRGITKRNPAAVRLVEEKAEALKEYFKDTDVNVELKLNTGFNSLAFIKISGKAIHIYDKQVLDLIRKDQSYANVFREENGDVMFELAYARLTEFN